VELPRVNPVGVTERPGEFQESPRIYSLGARGAAALLLTLFVASVVSSTVGSLTAYCLTTWAGLPHLSGS